MDGELFMWYFLERCNGMQSTIRSAWRQRAQGLNHTRFRAQLYFRSKRDQEWSTSLSRYVPSSWIILIRYEKAPLRTVFDPCKSSQLSYESYRLFLTFSLLPPFTSFRVSCMTYVVVDKNKQELNQFFNHSEYPKQKLLSTTSTSCFFMMNNYVIVESTKFLVQWLC